MTVRTRFAPSPSGPLHLGHAYAAMFASRLAAQHDGTFLLRIEDIDQSRAREDWERQIYSDLTWLGLSWPHPVMRQSDRLSVYRAALQSLWDRGLLYPCSCRRRDINEALQAPHRSPVLGPDGPVYPGTCRNRPKPASMPTDANLRLDMKVASQCIDYMEFDEALEGVHGARVPVRPADLVTQIGDVVLARKDMGTSYHLSVVLDDAAQEITDVTRGSDLKEATAIHVVLQGLLGLPTPTYHHHRLITDEAGKRLAKRDDARALLSYRNEGATPAEILSKIGL